MAPSPKQPDLFPILDGESSVGVFYFPKASLSINDQVNDVVDTIEHLTLVNQVLAKFKINASAAPKFSPLVKWLARYEELLRNEKEKLLSLTHPSDESMPASMPEVSRGC